MGGPNFVIFSLINQLQPGKVREVSGPARWRAGGTLHQYAERVQALVAHLNYVGIPHWAEHVCTSQGCLRVKHFVTSFVFVSASLITRALGKLCLLPAWPA